MLSLQLSCCLGLLASGWHWGRVGMQALGAHCAACDAPDKGRHTAGRAWDLPAMAEK